ncbi:Shikimate kinase [termite gut metagenome]|uniref:Shikimate kinase n=1 Tax=termite gut metagenome TaxID=433724 RepID=A0A5J4RTH1_9ZZZZ
MVVHLVFFDNIDFMNQKGKTVFLKVHPDILFHRLRVSTTSRPVLKDKTDEELHTFITQTLEIRSSFYTQAQYTFNTDKLENRWQIDEAVCRICDILKINA